MHNRVCGLLLCSLWACAPRPVPHHRIVVRVESDANVALAGARLLAEGRLLAESDASGTIATELTGHPGEVVKLQITCPSGHRSPTEPLSVLLRALAERGKLPEFQVQCPPLTRNVVVAVRATNGENLPVRYLGEEIARTDAHGAAHALLTAAPGESLSLTIDTSAPQNSKLMPQQPELKFTVPERDELVVFDQSFTKPKVKVHARKAPPPPPPEPVGPQRI